MKKKLVDAPQWFFMWTTGVPYICAIVGWHRRAVIAEAEKAMGRPWKRIYNQGGRAIRCHVQPLNSPFTTSEPIAPQHKEK